jgi:hypothetical protein
MTACANCSRTLQPAWKYCIYCGTRTPVAVAPRSRPLPKRTPVPDYAAVHTGQTPEILVPITPPPAPAPLSAAPAEHPVSEEWPENLGERPSLRSALAAVEVPAPTPPVMDDVDAPANEVAIAGTVAVEPVEAPAAAPVEAPAPAPVAAPEELVETDDVDELDLDEPAERTGSVNTLAILALLIGILACPLAAPFGHLAIGQVRASGERGLIPAWIAVVLGYLWLGFWIVFAITYFATNG